MVFQFGDIRFETLTSPTEFDSEESMNFIPMERITGKSVLQEFAPQLTVLSMVLDLRYQATDVPKMISLIRATMLGSKEAELVDGTGFSYGTFKIQKLGKTYDKLDARGQPLGVTVRLEFIEFAPFEPVSNEKLKARKAAFATIEAKPIQVKPKALYTTPQSLVSRSINLSVVNAKAASANFSKAASIPALFNKYVAVAARQLKAASDSVNTARNEVNKVTVGVSNINALKTSLTAAQNAYNTLLPSLAGITPSGLPVMIAGVGGMVDNQLRSLTASAAILTAVTAIRK